MSDTTRRSARHTHSRFSSDGYQDMKLVVLSCLLNFILLLTPCLDLHTPSLNDQCFDSESYVDAPVSKAILPTAPPSLTSFGIKSPFRPVLAHSAGCLSSSKSIQAESPLTSSGLQDGSPSAAEAFARLKRQSSSARTLTARNHTLLSASNSAKSLDLNSFMAVLRFSRASLSFRMIGSSDGTTHRTAACDAQMLVSRCGHECVASHLRRPALRPVLRDLVLLWLRLNKIYILKQISVSALHMSVCHRKYMPWYRWRCASTSGCSYQGISHASAPKNDNEYAPNLLL